jgi:hypothetical protein
MFRTIQPKETVGEKAWKMGMKRRREFIVKRAAGTAPEQFVLDII